MSRDCEHGSHEAARPLEDARQIAQEFREHGVEPESDRDFMIQMEAAIDAAEAYRNNLEKENDQLQEENRVLWRRLKKLEQRMAMLQRSKIVQLYDVPNDDDGNMMYEIGRLDGWLCAAVAAAYGKEDLT